MFDEMRGDDGECRELYRKVEDWLRDTPEEVFARRRLEADALFRRIGITFAVYGEGGDPERLIPFDPVPRIIDGDEWAFLTAGLAQRARALNLFLRDVYHDRDIVRAGIVPEDLIARNKAYMQEMQGFDVPGDIYTHIAGIDLVRTGRQDFYVLEDNCRTPSGVSYMLENREVMMRLFPELFRTHQVQPISHYPEELLATLREATPTNCDGDPVVAILTPGSFNSAYYEHSFLADEMGIELVEGSDLLVDNNVVHLRTTEGLRRVDVIYRRIDDDFIDPLAFDPGSMIGIPGLFNAYRAGNVTLANAVGAGIGDDKSIYRYVPKMIEFYLGEAAILNNVPTHDCSKAGDLSYVLDNLHELVVKEVHGSGGYGMLVGPSASKQDLADFRAVLTARPQDYIAQPTLALSTSPTFVDAGIAPRHVDLRPFVLVGKEVRIAPGGLTRVALREGSLVVNSSQGGGTKDTWVLNNSTATGTG